MLGTFVLFHSVTQRVVSSAISDNSDSFQFSSLKQVWKTILKFLLFFFDGTTNIVMANSWIWFLNLSFTFISFFLDTGVQIWNAVEVNDIILKVEDPAERQKICELKYCEYEEEYDYVERPPPCWNSNSTQEQQYQNCMFVLFVLFV